MASAMPNFMQCPLVVWVDSFRPPGSPKLQYSDLYNGVFLCDVMQKIDSRPGYQDVIRTVRDFNIRLQNWDILIRNIKAYYSDVLQQVLIVKLPNIQMISRDPDKDASFSEIKKALLLILGCAVQCEYKEQFITVIMDLELNIQQDIVESIKQITDDSQSILPTDCQDRDKLFGHLIRLVHERNDYADVMCDLAVERDFYQAQAEGKTTVPVSPTGSPEKHHMVVELTECKAKIRKLKQELDEKQETLSDVRDENEEHKSNLSKLRNENVELLKDARSARSLRDELDILREKMGKIHNYEAEILKYKERLNEMDFYKARVEELREDNAILIENKGMLEEQLSSSHKRIETVVQLEQEMVKYRQQIEDMAQERDEDQERIRMLAEENAQLQFHKKTSMNESYPTERDEDRERIRMLAEENAQLQFHKKTSMNESTNLEQELEATKAKIAGVGGAISDQLKETTNAKILRLELENQHLLRKIEDMRESSLIENTSLHLQLEKENQRLSGKVEKLQHEARQSAQKCYDLEEQNRELVRDKEHVVQTVEITKDSAERQIRELEEQNEDLTNTIEVLRSRNEQTHDTKLKDLERENKRLHESISVKNQHLSKAEFENRQLQKTYHRARDNVDKINDLENEKDNLERENMELRQTLQAQEFTCEKADKLEQEHSNLDLENQKLQRKLASLQTTLQKKDQVEQENINIKVENQKMAKMLDNLKHSTSAVADVENENSLLKKELQQLQRTVEAKKTQGVKLEKMELDLMDLDNENMKLQRTLEITTNRVQQLEKDNSDLELEVEKSQEQLESSKYSQKRLAESEKQVSQLEQECLKLQKDNSQLTKENKRNKVTLEARENAIDDLTTKYSMLDLSHKELRRNSERDTRLYNKDSEREHKQLLQNLQVEKQTIASLRTEMVDEKIRTQELSNELERLHQDLEKVGLHKNQLLANSPNQQESRFKALESMMQDALNKSLAIKEDKIHALESRLEESKNRNLKLQEELRLTRRECESLKQRFEEESLGHERERQESRQESSRVRNSPFMNAGANNEKQTSHLVKLERNNATLLAENDILKSQNTSMNQQIKKLESQNSDLHSQNAKVQGQCSSLQSQNASLQVENATLQAQCSSLQSQNVALQKQLATVETDHKRLSQLYGDLQNSQEQLLQDHEALQKIHDQSAGEYESLISEHGSLKSVHKSLKNENRELQQQINGLIHGKDDDNKVKEYLQRERDNLQMEKKSMGNLQAGYGKLRDDHERLKGDYDRLKAAHGAIDSEKRDLLAENKKIKSEYNLLQQENAELKDRLKSFENNFYLLSDKYTSLCETHQKLEDDREQMMNQMELLIGNNQDLLDRVLGSKDQMAGQEKSYLEQLSDLRRQKERLEEKIMDHYKQRDKQKKNKSFGAMLLQRVRGLKRSKSRPNLAEGSPDNSSMGSGSYAEAEGDNLKKTDKRRYRSRRRGSSAGGLGNSDSPKLSKQKRGLARSTTALDASPSNSVRRKYASYDLRGSRSTDDLLSDTLRSRGDIVSLSNSTNALLLPGMGRAASDDEGGFNSRHNSSGHPPTHTNNNNPMTTGEFLTLEEFLAEGVDKKGGSPKSKRKIELRQDDTESRSSENSDGSARRRRPAPLPPGNHNNRGRIGSLPDVAAVSQPDLSMSRMSRVSTGSSGSSQDVRPESAFTAVTSPQYSLHPSTSTPAKAQPPPYGSHKPFDDLNSSAFSRVSSADHRNNGNYNHVNVNSPHTPQYRADSVDAFSPPGYQTSREPTPDRDSSRLNDRDNSRLNDSRHGDRDSSRLNDSRLTPSSRLDMLTRGNSVPPTSQQPAWNSPNYSSPRDQRDQRDPRSRPPQDNSDMSVRSAQSSQQNWVKGPQGASHSPAQRPMKAPNPAYPRSHSPGSAYQPEERNINSPSSTPQKKGNILVSRANIGPRPYQKNTSRARPASAFGAPMNNSFQNDDSFNSSLNNSRSARSDMNNSMLNQSHSDGPPSYNSSYDGQDSAHTNGPVHVNKRPSRLPVERPKSVPPTMFNQLQGSDSDSSFNNEFPSNHKKGTPPVPPPRKNKDILTTGRYSILREPTPTSPTKPGPGPGPGQYNRGPMMNNSQISPNQGGPRQQQHQQQQDPRMGPQGSQGSNNNSKPTPPKPMKPEEGDKKNSIWRTKRVTFDIDGLPESMIL